MCETHGQRDEWKLPHWPITSLDHSILWYPQGPTSSWSGGGFSTRPTVGPCSSGVPSHLLAFTWLTKSLLAASWDWLKTHTPLIPHGHLHVSFHNTQIFSFNYMTTSTYFYRYILSRESDSLVKHQYARLDPTLDSSALLHIYHSPSHNLLCYMLMWLIKPFLSETYPVTIRVLMEAGKVVPLSC